MSDQIEPNGTLDEREVRIQLRQLELVDRVLGLEAEVARLTVAAHNPTGARERVEQLERELHAVYSSRTWRVGTAVLRPLRAIWRR